MASPALLALLLLLVLCSAQAQQVQLINYDALPGCARGCTTLKTAQDGCIPPQAGVSTQQTYVSCFCQSAFLVNLKTTAQGLCDAACPSTADQNAIKDWYNKYCSSGGTEGAAGTSTKPSASATSAVPSATNSAKDQSNEQGLVGDKNKSGYEGSWLSAHWRWIVMLVVIFTALALLTVVGIFLKRRARARHDARQANVAAPEAAFGSAPPPLPPLRHDHDAIDFGSSSSITAVPGANASVGNIAQNFLGRNRTHSNPLGRFPNSSQQLVQPVPSPHNVWGPHQHQAATRGYEYPTYVEANADRYVPSPSPSVTPSPAGSSSNASLPHGPSPLGPRKSPSRGELSKPSVTPPLIASAGRTRAPSRPDGPDMPRLNTAVGASKPPPQQVFAAATSTPPKTPPPRQPSSTTPPSSGTPSPPSLAAAVPPVPSRNRSQDYGADARYHNAGWPTGGMSPASSSRRDREKNAETQEKKELKGGWTSSRENLRGEASRGRSRGGALVSADEEGVDGGGNAMGVDSLGGGGGGGSRRRVTSPLSADNAREKLRRKLSRQGSGFFGEGEEGKAEREGVEGRF